MIEGSKFFPYVMKKHINKELVTAKHDLDFESSTKWWILDDVIIGIILISLENIEALHIVIVISMLN